MQILLFFIQISFFFLEFGNVIYILKLNTVDTYVIRTWTYNCYNEPLKFTWWSKTCPTKPM